MRVKVIAVGAMALSLGGCATTKVMDGIMTSWEGAHIDQAIAQWGYPDGERTVAGRKLYVWNYTKTADLPSISRTTGYVTGNAITATTTHSGGGVLVGNCDRILEVDSAGTIVAWQWEGNNCPFAEALEYKHWRRR